MFRFSDFGARLGARMFHLDLRALAVLRISLSLILIWDVLVRFWLLEDFHCDSGFLPRRSLLQGVYAPAWFCFHNLSGTYWFNALLFVVHGASLVGLALGYRTRLNNVVVWTLFNSLQSRNPYILDSGDRLLMMILLWGFFSDWGRCFSLDYRGQPPPPSYAVVNIGTVGLLSQAAIMYWLSAYWKWHPVWVEEGTALYYALSLDLFTRPAADLLLPYPDFLRVLTAATMVVEIVGPIFLLSGVRPLRILAVLGLGGLHFGILLFMSIGIFAPVCLTLLSGFWPWDKARISEDQRFSGLKSHHVLPLSILLLVLAWNLHKLSLLSLPVPAIRACNFLKADQYWNLFAPRPRIGDSWYILEVVSESGKQFDLWESREKPLRWERPKHTSTILRSHRDRIWGTALEGGATNEYTRQEYVRCKVRRFNERHPEDPVSVARLYAMKQATGENYRWEPARPELLVELSF